VRSELGTKGLTDMIAALRCGLDFLGSWTGEKALRCAELLGIEFSAAPREGDPLPFDVTRAHGLYKALFGGVEDLLKNRDGSGKHLLIVPSGPLTALPSTCSLRRKRPRPRWVPRRQVSNSPGYRGSRSATQ
jgi:hypothetical protein